jgi:hypothetical protein
MDTYNNTITTLASGYKTFSSIKFNTLKELDLSHSTTSGKHSDYARFADNTEIANGISSGITASDYNFYTGYQTFYDSLFPNLETLNLGQTNFCTGGLMNGFTISSPSPTVSQVPDNIYLGYETFSNTLFTSLSSLDISNINFISSNSLYVKDGTDGTMGQSSGNIIVGGNLFQNSTFTNLTSLNINNKSLNCDSSYICNTISGYSLSKIYYSILPMAFNNSSFSVLKDITINSNFNKFSGNEELPIYSYHVGEYIFSSSIFSNLANISIDVNMYNFNNKETKSNANEISYYFYDGFSQCTLPNLHTISIGNTYNNDCINFGGDRVSDTGSTFVELSGLFYLSFLTTNNSINKISINPKSNLNTALYINSSKPGNYYSDPDNSIYKGTMNSGYTTFD